MRVATTTWVLTAAVCAGPALASPPPASSRGAAAVLPARQCPALFGDRQHLQRNRRQRQAVLDWVDEEQEGVTVAHTHPGWREPQPLRLRGLRLVSVAQGSARVQLSAELARAVSCAPGQYRIGVDDALSAETAVLALLRQGLLVRHRGRLRYLATPMAPAPRWLMAWHMGVELHLARSVRRVIRLTSTIY